ncbi:MAG: hypothetical protein IJ997_04050 [Mycoplasmataceae bacterium]|nr:hypothetical protein [Mycoplasmataceae bacterium]
MVLTYSREELLHYCKTFVVPKSKNIQEWEEGENFCISFLEPKEEYILFVGKYLINLLKIECEESEQLKYYYALLTFLMCDNLLDRSIVDKNYTSDLFHYSFHKRKYTLSYYEKCALVKNIKHVFIQCKHLNSDTEIFESGSCNQSYNLYNINDACINCFVCNFCEYCIDCTDCYKCNNCVSCYNSQTCIYSEKLVDCVHCKYSKQCTSCRTCNYCNQCNNCNFCTQCDNCKECKSCKYCSDCKDCTHLKNSDSCSDCKDCSYLTNSENCCEVYNEKHVRGKEWDNVKEIKDIIKDSNYSLPIVKVVDINDEGWRLECTSKEYVIIYDSCGIIRFKGRLTCKTPCKLNVEDMYLCCGSIYNEHGVLNDILYIGRSKKRNQSKCLSIENFCKGYYLCEELAQKYDLKGNVIYNNI